MVVNNIIPSIVRRAGKGEKRRREKQERENRERDVERPKGESGVRRGDGG